ncbi:MAG: gluconate 2-dehydrogenase subunit 3 family protein [Gemmatimonadetes bacterium]|nr:gluconate 2-dehydrogenase subunit 3 family protein [Gemmatimonadota bacterium]
MEQALGTDQHGMDRRDAVRMLGAATLAAIGLAAPDVARAADYAGAALQQGAPAYKPVFFTKAEWPMVRALSDLVIPRDARSGSATDAGVPEFMDFIMSDFKWNQKWMRDGLVWLNGECTRRFRRGFVACTPDQQKLVLNDIAFPKKAPEALKPGVEFFTRFRDLTATGFWSSRIGYKDIGYMGNTIVPVWEGCPEPQLQKLGVSYKMSMRPARRR